MQEDRFSSVNENPVAQGRRGALGPTATGYAGQSDASVSSEGFNEEGHLALFCADSLFLMRLNLTC